MAPPTTLVDAINSAVPDRLRKMLMAVINDPSGRAIVENQLLQPVDASSTTTIPTKRCTRSANSATRSLTPPRTLMMPASGTAVVFPLRPVPRDSSWRDAAKGELEPDDDGGFWDNHWEESESDIDTDGMREQHPEGFMWDCCGKDGTASGCKVTEHTASAATTKKPRV